MDPLVYDMLQRGADKAAGQAVTLLTTVRIKAHSSIYPPPSRLYTKALVTLTAQRADGKQGQLSFTILLDNLVQTDTNPDGIFNTSDRTLKMRGAEPGLLLEDGIEYDGWFITNRRYGHGVGLSQRGAEQRAAQGHPYTQILEFYYAGTSLRSIGTFETAPALTSSTYTIAKSGISGINVGTTTQALLDGVSSETGSLVIISATGEVKTSGEVKTGYFVRTIYNDSSTYSDLPVIIFGDIDGNGKISQSDIDTLLGHLMNTNRLTGVYLAAADTSRDGEVNSYDVLTLLWHIQGKQSIAQ
jgi:hypothetical protein